MNDPSDTAFLRLILLLRFGDKCPICGARNYLYPITGRKVFGCGVCHSQVSPTGGTIFHKSSTPLWKWMQAIHWVAAENISAKELERRLGVTYPTAWRMKKEIRKLLAKSTLM